MNNISNTSLKQNFVKNRLKRKHKVYTLVKADFLLQVSDRIQFKGLPQLLCGTVAVLASFTLLFLPETLGQPLPVTMEEADELHQRYNIR